MQIKRKNIFKKYKWLNDKKRPFIISSDYDGLICASFLHHFFKWDLVGYYNYNSIWLSKKALKQKKEIIWVDLNILPLSGKSIGGQVVSFKKETPKGFNSSCNANILAKITSDNFKHKFPFSTILFLLWIHNINIKINDISQLLLLHSDNTWMKIQKYNNNIQYWSKILTDYNWDILFKQINSIEYDNKIDRYFYPKLKYIDAISGYGKLNSKYLKIKSRESKFNPDWDIDIILELFNLFALHLNWSPPQLPQIVKRIEGKRYKLPLTHIQKIGLTTFVKKNNVFSYAITNPNSFNYTNFKL
tara:strand:- start:1774 stop:2679 length:906 start_codon:yes stop_codon:yes gene_type:complete